MAIEIDITLNQPNLETEITNSVPNLDGEIQSTTTYLENNYNNLTNKPKINNVELRGNKSLTDLGIASATDLTNHINNTNNPHSVTKLQVGLGNVDNTSDLNKPISTATQTAIDGVQANLTTHINNTNNPHSVTKSQVGLSNVDNTSDLDKPISTLTQNAITNETNARIDADTTLQDNIDDEEDARTLADSTLNELIEDEIENRELACGALTDAVEEINDKIPSDASSSNQLADKNWVNTYGGKVDDVQINGTTIVNNKIANIIYQTNLGSDSSNSATVTAIRAFVNSSIESVAAYYVTSNVSGDAFATKSALDTGPYYYAGSLRTPTRNDYVVVIADETHDGKSARYTYTENQWAFQYTFNMQFTQAQIDAINSGITSAKVALYDAHLINVSNPHSVTKSQVGLENVDNTSDLDKPISTATQTALDARLTTSSASSGFYAYVRESGVNGVRAFSSGNMSNTIAYRDANGRFKVASPSDSSDVANKSYVDTGLNKKENGFSLSVNANSSGNPRMVKILTIDYSTAFSEDSPLIKFSITSGHGNSTAYIFLEDIILGARFDGVITCKVYKFYETSAGTIEGASRNYGDVFYVNDTTNKIVDFYVLMGQYCTAKMKPYIRTNAGTSSVITQYTGTATYYSSGTKTWANNNLYATTNDLLLKAGLSDNNSFTGDNTFTHPVTVTSSTPLLFKGYGSGTYNSAAFVCNTTDKFGVECPRETDSASGAIVPYRIGVRGGQLGNLVAGDINAQTGTFTNRPTVGGVNVALVTDTPSGNFVTTDTTQTITGEKTFNNNVKIKNTSVSNVIWNITTNSSGDLVFTHS